MSNKYVQRHRTFSETGIISKETVHTWKINNFQALCTGERKTLTTYGIMVRKRSWRLTLYPFVRKVNRNEDYIDFNLTFSKGEEEIEIESRPHLCSICLVDVNNKEHEMYKGGIQDALGINLVEKSYVFNEKNGLLPNGNLIIRIKLHFPCKVIEIFEVKRPCKSNPKPNGHEKIFNEEKFSDVKIIVGDKVFWAYKGLLAIESPVFDLMFVHDTKENNENTVRIEDIDHEVVQEMLRFIYTGKVNNIEDVARGLLAAADKYAIEDLKMLCEQTLIDDLSNETVIGLLALAEEYGANFLKDRALDYFKLHAKEKVKNEQCKIEFNSLIPLS